MSKAAHLVELVILRQLSVPAMNRWTTLAPAMHRVTLMLAWHGVVADALQAKLEGGPLSAEPEASDVSSDAQLGAPADQMRLWHRVNQKRASRVLSFFTAAQTLPMLLVWQAVVAPILQIHWKLFRFATFHHHSTDQRCSVVEFLRERSNPAGRALTALALGIWDPGASVLQLLRARFGLQAAWPQDVRRWAWAVLVVGISELWRRLVHPWRSWPWRLWEACDPCLPLATRMAAAEAFAAAPNCCLDPGMSRRVRGMIHQPGDLLQGGLQAFLQAVFERAVATSTFIERQFASLAAWGDNPRAAQHVSSVSAKHMCASALRVAERFWAEQGTQLPRGRDMARPVWAGRQRRGPTALQLFQRGHVQAALAGGPRANALHESLLAWRALSGAERDVYRRRARGARAVQAQMPQAPGSDKELADVPTGPWGIYAAQGPWPLSRYRIAEARDASAGAFRTMAKKWDEALATVIPNCMQLAAEAPGHRKLDMLAGEPSSSIGSTLHFGFRGVLPRSALFCSPLVSWM